MQKQISDITKLAGLSVAGLLFSSQLAAKEQEQQESIKDKSPNILFILTDDQGWADLSQPMDPEHPTGFCDYFETPYMNQIFQQGMRFTSGYAPAPISTPTRRSIQYGMTPARQHGTEFLGSFDPEGKWSIAEALKKANPDYRCAHFGKWGGVITGTWSDKESQMPGHPKNNGYDAHDGLSGNKTGTFYGRDDEKREFNGICLPDPDPKRTPSVTRRSVAFMKEQVRKGNPFYLQVSYYAIHTAFQAKQETMDRYAGKELPERMVPPGIAPMLEELDAGIGNLIRAVKKLNIQDNTYIFFMSDNGGEPKNFWEKNNQLKTSFLERSRIVDEQPGYDSEPVDRNHPLNRYKQWLYEGGIRVPFAVAGPGIEAGSICRIPVSGWDLLPTFYDLAGGTEPLPQQVDGGSMADLLQNADKGTIERPVEGLFFHRPDPPNNTPGHSAYRLGRYKLILWWTEEGNIKDRELYNLHKDAGEQHDLSEKMSAKADEMQQKLIEYLREVDNCPL